MLTTRYHLDEAHLSYYDEKLKSWASSQPVKTLPSSLYPWTLTEKAGAVTCWPVGGTQLKPTVDFLFTETPPASGDKGPSNPSTIEGVSSIKVTRCGKNLFLTQDYDASGTISGITWTVHDDGTVVANGTANGNSSFWIVRNRVLSPGTYTFKCEPGASGVADCKLTHGSTSVYAKDYPITFTTTKNEVFSCRFFVVSGATLNGYEFHPQLELGFSVGVFEKGEGTDYTLPLGNTYYGGSIDLATGLMTVTWVGGVPPIKYVDSVSDGLVKFVWNYNGEYRFYGGSFTPMKNSSTHFINTITAGVERIALSGNNDGTSWGGVLVISDARIGGAGLTDSQYLANAQQWLVENSVVFAAQIWTPFTVTLTPTQILSLTQADKYTPRLNTVYTDASAVQVGYVKSPIREEYELTQAIVAQGGNV